MNWSHPLLWYLLGLASGGAWAFLAWFLYNIATRGYP